jgi:hypothetical protein
MWKLVRLLVLGVAATVALATCGGGSGNDPDAGGVIGGDCIVSRSAIDTCMLR